MKVLMISRDRNTITPNTSAYERMRKYRALVEDLFIWVPGFSRLEDIKNVDVVTSQDPFETGFLAWIIARKLGAKLELQIHTDFLSPFFKRESFKNRIRYLIARFILPKADCVRVVSRRIQKGLADAGYVLKAAPVVLPIVVSIQDLPARSMFLKEKYPQFETIFLMASRFTREKNIHMALEAMAEISKTHPRAGLVVVGSGPLLKKLQAYALRLGMQGSVVFEPWSSNLGAYYASADAFLLTSNYEGYALTLVEAASAGCPIITTDVGIVGDLITEDFALIAPVGDTRHFVRAVRFFIEDAKWAREARSRLSGFSTRLPSEREYLDNLKKAWTTCGVSR